MRPRGPGDVSLKETKNSREQGSGSLRILADGLGQDGRDRCLTVRTCRLIYILERLASMKSNLILKLALVGATLTSLGGCLGSSNSSGPTAAAPTVPSTGGGTTGGGTTGGGTTGGGTTGGGTTGGGTTGGTTNPADFNSTYLSYALLTPTQGPITGTATYDGKVSVLTLANTSDSNEAIFGDANMTVDFGGTAAKPISGTVGNLAGKVNGVDTVIAGTLSTANAAATDPNSVTTSTPGGVTLTNMTATFNGDVTSAQPGLTGNANMILSGNFKDANGQKLAGGNATTINSGGSQVLNSSGAFYADKQ